MKLPDAFARLLNSDKKSHELILLLAVANLLLLIILFVFVGQKQHFFPQIIPVGADTPTVRFSLISPAEGSSVSGTVPLVTTLSNGPQITQAKLTINGRDIQTVFSQETEKLTVFWDTTKVANGKFQIIVTAYDTKSGISQLYSSFTVENKTEDQKKPVR